MTLIGEARSHGGFSARLPVEQHGACLVEPTQDQITVGTSPKQHAKVSRQLPAVMARCPLQIGEGEALIKAGLQIGSTEAIDQTFAFERTSQPALFSEPDCLSGLLAFLEKRRPEFRGRS